MEHPQGEDSLGITVLVGRRVRAGGGQQGDGPVLHDRQLAAGARRAAALARAARRGARHPVHHRVHLQRGHRQPHPARAGQHGGSYLRLDI